ncbi:hypothetical protein FB451DRAFT_1432020 [Mycena latifolia]|nr:hypothetical protein FB451DRAFT_1432020 [Mycena latifolia]
MTAPCSLLRRLHELSELRDHAGRVPEPRLKPNPARSYLDSKNYSRLGLHFDALRHAVSKQALRHASKLEYIRRLGLAVVASDVEARADATSKLMSDADTSSASNPAYPPSRPVATPTRAPNPPPSLPDAARVPPLASHAYRESLSEVEASRSESSRYLRVSTPKPRRPSFTRWALCSSLQRILKPPADLSIFLHAISLQLVRNDLCLDALTARPADLLDRRGAARCAELCRRTRIASKPQARMNVEQADMLEAFNYLGSYFPRLTDAHSSGINHIPSYLSRVFRLGSANTNSTHLRGHGTPTIKRAAGTSSLAAALRKTWWTQINELSKRFGVVEAREIRDRDFRLGSVPSRWDGVFRVGCRVSKGNQGPLYPPKNAPNHARTP